MKEFTPLNFYQKKERIEEDIEHLEEQRLPIVSRKKEIDEKLAEYNSMLKEGYLPDLDYQQIQREKTKIIREKSALEQELLRFKGLLRKKHLEKDKVWLQSKSIPADKLKELLLELRDKYMSFSSDTTRVSSMRAMSAKFIEEIQLLLKYVD